MTQPERLNHSSSNSLRQSVLPKGIVFGSFSLFLAVAIFFVAQYFGASHSFSQLIALPFFLGAIYFGGRAFVPVPGILIAISLMLSIVGVVVAHQDRGGDLKSIAIARLVGDELETVTQSFWRNLNQYLKMHGGPRLVRESAQLSVGADVGRDLADHNRDAVIWGSTRWINLSVHAPRLRTLSELLSAGSVVAGKPALTGNSASSYTYDFLDFQLITALPEVGLSLNPEAATVEYLTFILMGAFIDRNSEDLALSSEDRELYLWQASGVIGSWISQVHRALPALLLANMKLVQSLRADQFQSSELDCAIKLYKRGLKLINLPEENLELFGALANNLAVAEYINFQMNGVGQVESAVDLFRKVNLSKRGKQKKNWFEPVAWRAAYNNLMLLNQREEYQMQEQSPEPKKVSKKRKRSK